MTDGPYDYGAQLDDQAHAEASSALAGVNGVSPQSGADAIQNGPVVGVPPSVAMRTPEEINTQSQQQRDQDVLRQSPPVRNFVARADPAHVAAAQDSLPHLAGNADMIHTMYPNGIATPFHDIAASFGDQWGAIQDLAQKMPLLGNMIASSPQIAGALELGVGAQSVISGQFTMAGRVAAALGTPAGVFDIYRGTGANGKPIYTRPSVEESTAYSAGILGILSGVAGGEKGVTELPESKFVPGGPPHITPEGPVHGPSGFVHDEQGLNAAFPSVRAAGQFVAEHGEADNSAYNYILNPDQSISLQRRNIVPPAEGVPPVGAHPAVDNIRFLIAQADEQHIANIQDNLAANPLTESSPLTMEEFLKQQTSGNVTVDPERISELNAEGHDPFPEMRGEVQRAVLDGTDLEVPVSRYLTATAGQPFAEALNKATVFRDGGVSVDDAKNAPPALSLSQVGEQRGENTLNRILQDAQDVQVPFITGDPVEDARLWEVGLRERGLSEDKIASLKEVAFPGGMAGVQRTGGVSAQRAGEEPFTPMEEDKVRALVAAHTKAAQDALKASYLSPLFTDAEALGMTPAQFAAYSQKIGEIHSNVVNRMQERAYGQVRRERSPEWKAEVASNIEKLTPQIEALPIIRAARQLSTPGFKLDRDLTTSFFPHSAARLDKSVLKNGGNHPDDAADLLGYPSGGQLVSDLADMHEAMRASGARNLNEYVALQARGGVEAAAMDRLGHDMSPESIQRAAMELVNGPARTDLLSEELQLLGAAPHDIISLESYARERFEGLPVRRALNSEKLEAAVYKHGGRTQNALQAGDIIKAFKSKQRQFIQHLMAQQSCPFIKEYAKASRVIASIAKKPVVRGMDQTYRNQLRGIVEALGVPVRTKKFISVQESLRGKTLEQFIAERNLQGLRPPYVPLPSPALSAGGLERGTVEAFRGYRDMILGLSDLGRQEKAVFLAGERMEMDKLVEDIKSNADAIGRRVNAGDLHTQQGKRANQPSLMSRITDSNLDTAGLRRTAQAAVLRGENILFWLDRGKNGPLMRAINTPLQAGDHYKSTMIQKFSEGFKAFTKAQPKDWVKTLGTKINVPELTFGVGVDGETVRWLQYRSQAIMAARYLGERSALDKLLEGFGWDEATFRAALDRVLTKADWDYVQHTWDMHEQLVPAMDDLYRAESGLPFAKESRIEVPTLHGTYPGGHVHVDYDWGAFGETTDEVGNPIEKKDPNALGDSDLFGPHYRTATPPNGYTLKRTQFSAPVNLDHNILPREYEAVIHDLAYRSALIQAAKVMRQPGVQQAFREVLGPEYTGAINQMLMSTARQASYDQQQLKAFAALARGFRKRFTMVQIGYNLATIIKHGGIAAFHIAGEVGIPQFMVAQKDIMSNDFWHDFVYDNSGEVRNAQHNLDRDVREALGDIYRKQGFIANYQYHAFTMFSVVKQWEAQATWLAKYRQLTANGLEEADAMALSDKAVRDTQGSGSPVNLPMLWQGGGSMWEEIGKLTNMFTGFENTATNRMWLASRESNAYHDHGWAGGRRDFNRMWAVGLSFILGPALYATLFDAVTGGRGKHVVQSFVGNAVKGLLGGSIPMGNTVAAIPEALTSRGHDLGGDPLLEAGKGAIQTTVNLWDAAHGRLGHVEDRWVQHLVETAGYLTNKPVKPIAKGAQYFWDLSHNHVQNAQPVEITRGLIFGPTPEQARK